AAGDRFCILIASAGSNLARQAFESEGTQAPKNAESLAVIPVHRQLISGKQPPALLASGSDPRGLSYAILEVADRVRYAADPMSELKHIPKTIQQPSNPVRSIGRLFASDVEDKPWFNDRSFWERYLTELAVQRF